jgi:hypothetical protein
MKLSEEIKALFGLRNEQRVELVQSHNYDDTTAQNEPNPYFICEYVAIPENFDIRLHMSIKEQAGINQFNDVNPNHISLICETLKTSAIFSMVNNTNISVGSCIYLLHILNELGVVLKHKPSIFSEYNQKNKKNFIDAISYIEDGNSNGGMLLRGDLPVQSINIVIFNLWPLLDDEYVQEAITIADNLEKTQEDFEMELAS